MHVECPNCSTQYEVPPVHFVDGARKLRCTQCGYRWKQSATDVDLAEGKKSAPLLDMLEPTIDVEQPVSVEVFEHDGPVASLVTNNDGADRIAAQIDPAAADRAYEEIDEALSPLPAPAVDDVEDTNRRWQFGLLIVAAALLLVGLIIGREGVVRALPFTQPVYRLVGLEPWSELRDWRACVVTPNNSTEPVQLRYSFENLSDFHRPLPFVMYGIEDGQAAWFKIEEDSIAGRKQQALTNTLDDAPKWSANPLYMAADETGRGKKALKTC